MAWWAFQNVVVTAILALAVAAICRTRGLSPVVRHALWVLVLIKFVTPPLMAWPWHVPDPLGIQSLDARPAPAMASTGAETETALVSPTADPAPASDSSLVTAEDRRGPDLPSASTMWSWLLGVWIAGAIALLAIEAIRLWRIARAVRSGQEADPNIVGRVQVLAARLDLPPIPVVAMPHATAPAIWCLGRPRLLWPAELPAEFTDTCIDALIVHELAHVKRRDHIVGWIELAASVVWWWNPLFWFVRSALREQAELACDGWVIATLPNGRRAYAESLLALSSAAIVDVPASPMTAVLGVQARSRRALERRLVMIMKGRASRRMSVVGLLGLAMMAVATLPVWATGQQTPPPPPPSAPAPVAVAPQTPPPPPATAPSRPTAAPPTMAATTVPVYPQGAPPPSAPTPATAVYQTTPVSPQGRPAPVVTTVAPVPSRAVRVAGQQPQTPTPQTTQQRPAVAVRGAQGGVAVPRSRRRVSHSADWSGGLAGGRAGAGEVLRNGTGRASAGSRSQARGEADRADEDTAGAAGPVHEGRQARRSRRDSRLHPLAVVAELARRDSARSAVGKSGPGVIS